MKILSNGKVRILAVMAALTFYVNMGLASLFAIVLCLGVTLADQFSDPSLEDGNFGDLIPADKRYAMMSYGYGRGGGRRNRYDYYRNYYGKRYRYYSYWKPWNRLPNRKCYRQRCNSNRDCCKYHNICDKNVKICYDCWYGYPCRSSRDCCQRFPRCNSQNVCSRY